MEVRDQYEGASSAAVLTAAVERSKPSWLGRAGLRLSEHQFILRIGDLCVAAIAAAIALWLWTVVAEETLSIELLGRRAVWFLAIVPWMLLLLPAYHVSVVFSSRETVGAVIRTVFIGLALYPPVYFFAPRSLLPRLVVLYFLAAVGVLTVAWRLAYIGILMREEHRGRVAIIGLGRAGHVILDVLRRLAKHTVVVAFVDHERNESPGVVDRLPIVAGPDGLRKVVAEQHVSQIVLATQGEIEGPMLRALVDCQEAGADVVRMSTIYERFLERIPIDNLEADWVFTSLVDSMRLRDASALAKRAVDIVGGLLGTGVFLLLVPIIGPAIWLSGGGPILFRQRRVGRDNKPFQLIKFRTMVADAERDGPRWAEAYDGRVTALGRFLRRSRLDETPQFLNVLRGDMSLVGPRPERPEFVEELETIIPFYRARLMVRPGLTGWAQVNYRYGDSVSDSAVKLEYDLYYIKHRSMLFDLLIAVLTVKTMLMFSGR